MILVDKLLFRNQTQLAQLYYELTCTQKTNVYCLEMISKNILKPE